MALPVEMTGRARRRIGGVIFTIRSTLLITYNASEKTKAKSRQ